MGRFNEQEYRELIETLASEILEEAAMEKEAEEEFDPVMEKIAARYATGGMTNLRGNAKRAIGSAASKARGMAGRYADLVKGKGVAEAAGHMDPKYLREMAKNKWKGTKLSTDAAVAAKELLRARNIARAKQVGAIAAPIAGAGAVAGGAYAVNKAREKAAEYIEEAGMIKQAAIEALAEAEVMEDAAYEVLGDTGLVVDDEGNIYDTYEYDEE